MGTPEDASSPIAAVTGNEAETVRPQGPIRLGETGYLRFQKYIEIIYTPVVPAQPVQPTQNGAEDFDFFPEVEADLVATGVDWETVGQRASEVPVDPHFEDTYRAAFLNYADGRRFRTRGRPKEPQAMTELLPSGGEASLVPPMTSPFQSALTPVYRVVVKTKGVYRLTQPFLAGAAPGLVSANPLSYKMLNKGVEVPIRIAGEGDGQFNVADSIEFYGEGIVGEPELLVNYDFGSPTVPDVMQANDFTDENVYFLFATGEAGPRARIPDLSGAVTAFPLENSFSETVHREFDTIFLPNGADDPFYQTPFLLDNNGSYNPVDPNAANCGYNNTGVQNLATRLGPSSPPGNVACAACDLGLVDLDPNASATTATVRVRVRGITSDNAVNPDHMSVVQVGTVASQSNTRCWDDETLQVQTVNVPQSALAGGAGVYIGLPGLLGTVGVEGLAVDWIEVDYRRLLRLNAASLTAKYTNVNRTYLMTGFPTMTTADMAVYDISRVVPGSTVPSPRRITGGSIGGSGSDFSLQFSLAADPNVTQRSFAAAGFGGFKTPVRVETVTGEDLVDTDNHADMIVITTPQVVGAPPTAAYANYIAHRQTESGLTVKTVYMRDVYDYFSAGIETPEAIRSFLAYALDNWTGPSGTDDPPAYVMLVGDISLDYKNDTGDSNWINQVPTFIMYYPSKILDYYSSDSYLAAVVGSDQIPDLHLGRVAIRTPAEASVVFNKMLNYDLNPPTDNGWRARGVFLADKGQDPSETGDFESTQTFLAETYFGAPFAHQKIFYDEPAYANGTNPAAWRTDVIAAEDSGAALTSFFGHGSFDDWGFNTLWTSAHVPLLAATQKPTFLVNENCLVGGFHAMLGDTLAETFLKADGKGAVAVFAPAGLSLAVVNSTINNALYPDLFGLNKERRFGHLMTDVKLALSLSVQDLQAYTLLGDPAQRFTLPAPRPPINFHAATGQSSQVTLSWTASPDPGMKTRIYRTENPLPGGTYTLATPAAGVTGTVFVDTGVLNARHYFYRATAVDPNGPFEGTVSNFNSDCDITTPSNSGTDCVWSVPIATIPPSPPSGFKVTNPGSGESLAVSWNAPSEPDVASYTVRYGTVAGGAKPDSIVVAAPATGVVALNLTLGTTYYFNATATNTSALTSLASLEASGVPSVFEGINPPDFIESLDVRRYGPAPNSIELLWTPPPLDIHGGAITLSSFSIYRATNPFFVPGPAFEIAHITNPSAGSYVDPNASVPVPDYYYLISATDDRGFTSGAGFQLPNGISDMTLNTVGGNIVFNWTPVTVDVDGAPTRLDRYVLYASTQLVTRTSTDTLTPLISFITPTASTTSVPIPGSVTYYSLIVVDSRGNKSPF